MSKLQKFFFSILFVSVSFFVVAKARALDIENERPTPLRGVPSAEWIDISNPDAGPRYSYGDPEYTITIRNTAPETLPDMQFLADCAMNSGATIANCYYFSLPASAKLLNSKAYVNNKMKSVVALLKYEGANVFGDSYSASGNFNYWGRHLRQATDNSDSNALWESGNYSFNPNAQSYWDTGDPNKNSEMTETITRMSKDTKSPVAALVFNNGTQYSWNARPFYGVCGQIANCSDKSLYPEGRIWRPETNKDLLIQSPAVEYSGRGTILLPNRNLTIETSINPRYSENDAALGFIVQNGNVIIRNNTSNTMTVRASIFVPNGTITLIGNRINLIGSFVAKDFVIESNIANFIQDARGETSWPPGFRELKLPIVSSN